MRLFTCCHCGQVPVLMLAALTLTCYCQVASAQTKLVLPPTPVSTNRPPGPAVRLAVPEVRAAEPQVIKPSDGETGEGLVLEEQQAAERLASMCSQHASPWLTWLTLAAQTPTEKTISETPSDVPSGRGATPLVMGSAIGLSMSEDLAEVDPDDVLDEEPMSEGEIIEISESTMGAIQDSAVSSMPKLNPVPSRRESSPRNLRTPMDLTALDEVEDDSPVRDMELDIARPPRPLSVTIKKGANEPANEPPRLTLKSADEDMRDYLAQEEPSAQSSNSSRDDGLQGIDAEKAKRPDAGPGTSTPPVRMPITLPEPSVTREVPIIHAAESRRLQRVQGCLDHYLKNPETTTNRSPWAVMHALLPYGADYELAGPNGRVNAIGWMCHNGLCRTQRMFTPRGNSFIPNVGGGVQGHQGQFLAILAQCQVPLEYPIQIGTKQFTVEDLVRYEMATCTERSELTFKLIGLSYYVDSNKQWRANDGKVWSLQKLVQEELAQPIVGSACGGTHRLMGFTFSLKQRVLQGQPINGQYLRAAKFINEYVQYTWRLQNPDGSFSTNWYDGRGNEPNAERKVQTSGHMLEWLMFTIGDEELRSPQVEQAIDFLLTQIYDKRDTKWPIGPRGHATRALALYAVRMQSSPTDVAPSAASPVNASIGTGSIGSGPIGKGPTAGPLPGRYRTNPASIPVRSATPSNRRFRG